MTPLVTGKSGWTSKRLEDICSQITDGKHGDCQDQSNSRFYFLSCKDVANGKLNYDGARQITEADFLDTHRRTKLEPFDVLITNSGTIGRMALVPENELTGRTTFQKSVAILKPMATCVSPAFLYFALQADKSRLIEFAGGTAQKNLLLRDLRAFVVQLPPLPTQRRIASILGAYDDLIEVNRRRIAVLEEMARRLFDEWFVHFRFPGHEGHEMIETEQGRLPKGWTWSALGALCRDVRDTVAPSEVNPATPYVGLEHIPRRSTTLDAWGRSDEVTSTKHRFQAGDILFGKIRPYFHKVAWAPFAGVCSSDAIVIRPKKPEIAGLVLAVASSDRFVATAVQTSNGTKMPRANWTVLERYPVPMPPSPLPAKASHAVGAWVHLAATLHAANARLTASRDLLLPRLISGDLAVDAAEAALEQAA